ncbi:NAD-dependent epimerase/dehydratase family protein [Candidatus Peregrinibacteria bacterium]|nr:NAD-dependent epimerase/dehydratase family protein [Candidatus Peregrinibacteria bacterium]
MRHPVVEDDLRRIAGAPLPWSAFAGKTVLVSGAAGFLPAYMVETLLFLNETHLQKGPVKIIGLVRNQEGAQKRFAHYDGRPDLVLKEHDVCQPFQSDEQIHFIIHAASHASPLHYRRDPVGTLGPNVLGTHHLLSLANAYHAERFLFFSSGDVYGHVSSAQIPTKETEYGPLDPLDVRSCYGESKRMGENMCVSWHHQHGIPVTIVRPSHTYGPGMRLDDGRVFADFVADVSAGRDIVMKSDGSARRTFCYLADAVEAFFTVLLQGKPGEAYNVSNEACERSILQLAEILASLFPEKGIRVIEQERTDADPYMPSPFPRTCLDTTKIRSLGWKPTTSVEEGFRRTILSFP